MMKEIKLTDIKGVKVGQYEIKKQLQDVVLLL